MMRNGFVLAVMVAAAWAGPASADVVISTDATQNMSCSGGVCAPTATDAVLNVTDLENLLAAGNVDVVTTNGSIQANNIDITGAFSWSAASSLTLDADQSVTFSAYVQNLSTANVALVTNDGGTGGALTFLLGPGKLDTNALSINGEAYKMADSVNQLAAEIGIKPSGRFALSRDTNAGKDGPYYNSPIPVGFSGSFNGLGHKISNLEILDTGNLESAALFLEVKTKGSLASVFLEHATVRAGDSAASLVVTNYGTIGNTSASGKVYGRSAGGLININKGNVTGSWANVSVHSKYDAGGLVNINLGVISQSFAQGNTIAKGVGGLIEENVDTGTISDCYSLGSSSSKHDNGNSSVGGFVGYNFVGSIATSYSVGAVSAGHATRIPKGAKIGGFSGYSEGTVSTSYWDTDTSGTEQGSGDGNETGLTGLTTAQFQSGLPSGFDPSIWAEDPGINNGFPYLIANPPPQ